MFNVGLLNDSFYDKRCKTHSLHCLYAQYENIFVRDMIVVNMHSFGVVRSRVTKRETER